MLPSPLSPRQVRWARRWMTLALLGVLVFLIGLNPDLIGMNRSPAVGFVQVGVWLAGLGLALVGAYLALRVLAQRSTRSSAELGRSAPVGHRLCGGRRRFAGRLHRNRVARHPQPAVRKDSGGGVDPGCAVDRRRPDPVLTLAPSIPTGGASRCAGRPKSQSPRMIRRGPSDPGRWRGSQRWPVRSRRAPTATPALPTPVLPTDAPAADPAADRHLAALGQRNLCGDGAGRFRRLRSAVIAWPTSSGSSRPGFPRRRSPGGRPDGWLGFDPGVAQAANIGVFRLRWMPPGAPVSLDGDCVSVPIEPWVPLPGVCYQMSMGPVEVHTPRPIRPHRSPIRWCSGSS